jgi:MoaA/NifB/PqqE/SkfB family radical SAM enzyme
MIDIKDIRLVHVEASSRCNSHCPMCSRFTAFGELQPELQEGNLTEEVFLKLFTEEFTQQLEHVYFSGVYGDPCLNKLLPKFVDYLLDNGVKSISIDTNGGYRDTEWWASLARPNVNINFALDGASNATLGRYRIGVNYDKVVANLKAYVAAGGYAQWNFIVFKHNEHEVDLARQLAAEIGCDFRIKVTQKFRNNRNFKVYKNNEYLWDLEPPDAPEYRHNNIGTKEHEPISLTKFDLTKYNNLNSNKIVCKSQVRQEIFLAANGLVLPCCYLGTYTHDSPGSYQFSKLYDLQQFDLNKYSIIEILDKFNDISGRWNSTVDEGNLITCLQTCGDVKNHTVYHSNELTKQSIIGDKYE